MWSSRLAPTLWAWSAGALTALGWVTIQTFTSGGASWALWGYGGWIFGVYTLCLSIPLGVGMLVARHARVQGLARQVTSAERATGALLAALITSYGVYAVVTYASASFNSEGVRALVITFSIPFWLLCFGVLDWFIQRDVFPRLPTKRHTWLPKTIALGAMSLWALGMIGLEWDVLKAIGPSRILPLGVMAGACALGAVYSRASRIVGVLALLLACSIGAMVACGSMATNDTKIIIEEQWPAATALRTFFVPHAPPAPTPEPVKLVGESLEVCAPKIPKLSELSAVDPKTAPDIIFITIDALRWDRTQWSTYTRRLTPNLHEWGKQSAVFDRASTPASSTRQSIGAYFTGMHTSQREVPKSKKWNLSIDKKTVTLAETLKHVGYHTVGIVFADHIFRKKHGAMQGFKETDTYPKKASRHLKIKYGEPFQVDRIIAHLNNPKTYKKPKFIWTHMMGPHQPYRQSPEFKRKYGKGPKNAYDSAIHFTDHELGRLFDSLRSTPRGKNTYVVITADHGHAFSEHGKRFHGFSVYQEETHVPLVISGPDVLAKRHDTPVSVLSVYETILDVAGTKVPSKACVPSLKPVLEGKAQPPKQPLYIEVLPDASTTHNMLGLIDGDMKLVVQPKLNVNRLYDLSTDPKEKRDLSKKSPKQLKLMMQKLQSYQRARKIDRARFTPK